MKLVLYSSAKMFAAVNGLWVKRAFRVARDTLQVRLSDCRVAHEKRDAPPLSLINDVLYPILHAAIK